MKNMKKIIWVVPFLMSFWAKAQNPLPVIPFGDRKADLYYWDTNWIDHYEHLHPNTTFYPLKERLLFYFGDYYVGRTCIAETPIRVKGIAGMVYIGYTGDMRWVLDTTMSGRLPEYFIMYDSLYNQLGEGRWDTVAPTYQMAVRNEDGQTIRRDVYEIYFEKPVLVSGRFFVGGTTHNNLRHGEEEGGDSPCSSCPEHLNTYYPLYSCYNTYSGSYAPYYIQYHNPPYYLIRPYRPYSTVYPGPNETPMDTTFQLEYNDQVFLPFFAIIDTDFQYRDCLQPSGLGVIEGGEDSIVVGWDGNGAVLWQVQLWLDGAEPDSNMLFTVDTNRLTLYGLDAERNYNMRVMAECDTFHISKSPWSNTFTFRVSDYFTCAVPESIQVQPLDRNAVFVNWENGDAQSWELAVWREEGVDTTFVSSQSPYVVVDHLDTAAWYAACLRALCHNGSVSDWSDTLRFFVPNWDTSGVGIGMPVDGTVYLMPNPTRDRFTVLSSFELRKVELFAGDGKLVATFDAKGYSTMLDISAYPPGLYMVRIVTLSGIVTKRLVKL